LGQATFAAPTNPASSSTARRIARVAVRGEPGSSTTLFTMSSRAVEARVDTAHDAVVVQHGHRPVPALARVRRHVDLDPVAVAEELLGAVAIDDEVVERGEERRAAVPLVTQCAQPRRDVTRRVPAAGPRLARVADLDAGERAVALE
jgi:hypothetical protein